ncbi:unnamed protein product [Rhodiola kirilowii]
MEARRSVPVATTHIPLSKVVIHLNLTARYHKIHLSNAMMGLNLTTMYHTMHLNPNFLAAVSQNSRTVISRRTEQHHMRSASPSMVSLQGTARRRIRFDTSKVDLDELEKHLNPPEPQSIVSRLKAASLSSILVLVLLIVAPLVALALPMVSRIQPALLFARIQE